MSRTTAINLLAADLRSIDGGYSARGDRAIDALYHEREVKRRWDDLVWWGLHLRDVRRFGLDATHAQAVFDECVRKWGSALANEERGMR